MKQMKWWGWGSESKEYGLKKNKKLLAYIKEELDLDLKEQAKIDFANINLPKLTISEGILAEIQSFTNSSIDKHDRLTHCMGKSYKDLIRIRKGKIDFAPDIVTYPESIEEVQNIIKLAKENNLKIVPFGGGTSVVGGVETTCDGTICLDTKMLNKILAIDKVSQTAHVQAGILGPDLEKKLNKKGFTLGHLPQSFEFSTLGGWIATRGAGQNSTKYGKIEDMVEALTLYYPYGDISTKVTPATASGSDIKQLLIGSEGLFGIITDAVIKLHPSPESMHHYGFLFKNFDQGLESLRTILQNDITPSVARLSDAEETSTMMKMSSSETKFPNNIIKNIAKYYIKKKGYKGDDLCMLILGFEGAEDRVKFDFKKSKKLIKGLYLGTSPGNKWFEKRFELPYLRDELIDFGVLVDTLETATNWDNLPNLYNKTKETIESTIYSQGVKGFVQTHVSHIYREGASLYYTFVAKAIKDKEIEQWDTIKKAAIKEIIQNGGTLSHHHGIGKDHAAWMADEHGTKGLDLIRSVKHFFDPDKILNPGKMNI